MCDARNLHYITCIYMIHLIKYINVQNCIYIPVYKFSNRRDNVMRFSTLIYKKHDIAKFFVLVKIFFVKKHVSANYADTVSAKSLNFVILKIFSRSRKSSRNLF